MGHADQLEKYKVAGDVCHKFGKKVIGVFLMNLRRPYAVTPNSFVNAIIRGFSVRR